MGPKYKPDKFYTEDINDLVEKGGAGSGVKGHLTLKDYHVHESMKDAAKRGDLNKLRGAEKHFQSKRQEAKHHGMKEHEEHYKKLHHEAINHVINRLDSGSKDMKKCQEQLDELEKGGQGSGQRGHMTPKQVAERRAKDSAAESPSKGKVTVEEAYARAKNDVSSGKTKDDVHGRAADYLYYGVDHPKMHQESIKNKS